MTEHPGPSSAQVGLVVEGSVWVCVWVCGCVCVCVLNDGASWTIISTGGIGSGGKCVGVCVGVCVCGGGCRWVSGWVGRCVWVCVGG